MQAQGNYIDCQYYQKVAEAEYAYLQDDFKECYRILSDLETKVKLNEGVIFKELYKYALLSLQYENYQKAYKSIFTLISTYGYKLSDFEDQLNFDKLKKNLSANKRLSAKLQRAEQNFVADTALYNEIARMVKVDQQVRNIIISARDSLKSLSDTPVACGENILPPYYEHLLDSVDGRHYQQLCQIFKTKGFPLAAAHHYYPNQRPNVYVGLLLLLMHFHDSTKMDYLKPRLLHYIQQGECPPELLASMIDRSLMSTGQYLYGIYDNVGKERIVDFENIDVRRSAIGMPSYELEQKIKTLTKSLYEREK